MGIIKQHQVGVLTLVRGNFCVAGGPVAKAREEVARRGLGKHLAGVLCLGCRVNYFVVSHNKGTSSNIDPNIS